MTKKPAQALKGAAGHAGILLAAIWFGLIAGLLEGTIALSLRGVVGFTILVSPDILWIAPLFDCAFFLTIAMGLSASFRLLNKAPDMEVVTGIFSGVTLFGLLLLVGKVHRAAAVLLSLGVAIQVGRWLRGRQQGLLMFLERTLGILLVVALVAGTVGARWVDWREHSLVGRLPQAQAGAPNVLLITLDTLRADHLSSYGYERATSPNIDRLAHGGVLFEHAFANSSWTLPAHASLFTGRLPFEHKADWHTPLDGMYPTLAGVLATKGYLTAAFAANTIYVTPESGLARGFTRFEVYGSSLIDDAMRTAYGKKLAQTVLPRFGYFDVPGRKRASRVNQEFFRWLDGVDGRPFFAFLNYFDVHDPYVTVVPYQKMFSHDVGHGSLVNSRFQSLFRRKPTLTAEEIRREINSYDGALAYLDSQLGALFAELARRGVDKDTLILVTSDHGESFGNHDLFGHGNSLYLETLRVPLIFFWPDKIPAGVRVSEVVSLHRIPSTVMQLLGEASSSSSFPGRSLARLWGPSGDDEPAHPILSELSSGRFKGKAPNYPTADGGLKSLITDRWHFVRSETGHVELYAWHEDRQESRNLAESPATQAVVEEFNRQLQELLH
jgi:arylsulfatase A-like enzyme